MGGKEAGKPERRRVADRAAIRLVPRVTPGNLPVRTDTFRGRERERGELAAALATARLVTLTGPPGIGKTRLALEVGAELLPALPGGAWFCDLAAHSTREEVLRAIAQIAAAPPELLGYMKKLLVEK